jgi:hypothetical protein
MDPLIGYIMDTLGCDRPTAERKFIEHGTRCAVCGSQLPGDVDSSDWSKDRAEWARFHDRCEGLEPHPPGFIRSLGSS